VTWQADLGRLQRLFENLFRNSVEHSDADSVRVESLPDGFAVVDDGTGFDDPESALESGQSSNGGTGLGLAIVQRIAEANDWTVVAKNGESGARVEIHAVERTD
jgi:signal transduction histidine kinase